MAYLINPEDQDLLDSVREFCEKEIKEQCKEYDVSLASGLRKSMPRLLSWATTAWKFPRSTAAWAWSGSPWPAIMEEFAKADAVSSPPSPPATWPSRPC